MRAPVTKLLAFKLLAFALIAALAAGAADAAKKKPRLKRAAPAVTTDYDGTPIIMKGMRTGYPQDIMKDEPGTRSRTTEPRTTVPKTDEFKTGEPGTRAIRRVGSSTYVPPPVPSPMNGGPSPQDILRGSPQINTQPQINTFSDRVTQCNHSFALGAGVGNNPTERGAYVRQCAN